MVSGVGTLIGSAAVIFAAFKAGDAVTNWKRQKMAERKMEIAERILTASYRAQAALVRVRNPFMWAHEEYAAREKLEENAAFLGNTAERQKRLVVAQAYFDRIDKVREDRLPLDEMKPLAKVLFGDAVEDAIGDLDHQFWVIQTYVDEYIDQESPPPRGDGAEPSDAYKAWSDRDKKIKSAMYFRSKSENDEISEAVRKASEAINAACTPILTNIG
jgi:gas vesicle protein